MNKLFDPFPGNLTRPIEIPSVLSENQISFLQTERTKNTTYLQKEESNLDAMYRIFIVEQLLGNKTVDVEEVFAKNYLTVKGATKEGFSKVLNEIALSLLSNK